MINLISELGGEESGYVTYSDLKRALSQRAVGISWHAGWCRNTIKSRDGGAPGRSHRRLEGRVRFFAGGPAHAHAPAAYKGQNNSRAER